MISRKIICAVAISVLFCCVILPLVSANNIYCADENAALRSAEDAADAASYAYNFASKACNAATLEEAQEYAKKAMLAAKEAKLAAEETAATIRYNR